MTPGLRQAVIVKRIVLDEGECDIQDFDDRFRWTPIRVASTGEAGRYSVFFVGVASCEARDLDCGDDLEGAAV